MVIVHCSTFEHPRIQSSPNPVTACHSTKKTYSVRNRTSPLLYLNSKFFSRIKNLTTKLTLTSHNFKFNFITNHNRGVADYVWRCASRVVCFHLLCLAFVGEAHSYSSLPYACQHSQSYYYAGVDHLRGENLKKKLNFIIANHQSLTYKQVWDAIKILDAADVDKPEASSSIVEIYSLRVVSKLLAGKPEGWNREHLWPRSYGLINGPSLMDLHNIRPADSNVNSSRGNKYYGECSNSSTYCLKPANKEAASDTEADDKSWAPPVQVRGDIARALMYMAVCYGYPTPDLGAGIQLSDFPNTANREMGMVSTLLRWNEIDPPSREEKLRNERICRLYQHNRNPFVDHPEYANLIWNHAKYFK